MSSLPPQASCGEREENQSVLPSRAGYSEAHAPKGLVLSLRVSIVVGTSTEPFCERSCQQRPRGREKDATAVEMAGTLPLPTAGAQGDSG